MKELENKVVEYRFNFGRITQEKLAVDLGVSRQTIISIEKGKFNPSVKLALKMAEYFNCSVEDLFQLTNTEKEEKQ